MYDASDLTFRPARMADAREFTAWQYEPPYDCYNLEPSEETIRYMLLPEVNCHTAVSEDGIAAYCTFGEDARVPGGDYSTDALDIGLAVRPDLTGRGLGAGIVEAVVGFAWDRFEPTRLRVTIAERNQRAIKVWMARGFEQASTFTTENTILDSNRWLILGLESAPSASRGSPKPLA